MIPLGVLASATPRAIESDIPTQLASCQLWLDASDLLGVLNDQDAVAEWLDKSGKSHHFEQTTEASRPLFVESAPLTGKPMLYFNGTNNHMQGLHDALQYDGTREQTVLIVAYQDATFTGTLYAWRDGITGFQCLFQPNSRPSLFSDGSVSIQPNKDRPNRLQVLTYIQPSIVSAQPAEVRIEGTFLGQDTASAESDPPPKTSPVLIGARGDGSGGVGYPLTGYIGEIIVYDRILADSELKAVERYILDKWFAKTAPESLNGLFAHYKAEDLLGDNSINDRVELWPDATGGGRDAALREGSEGAVLRVNSTNGMPYLEFAQSIVYDFLGTPLPNTTNTGCSLFMVHRSGNQSHVGACVVFSNGKAVFGYRGNGVSLSFAQEPATARNSFLTDDIPDNVPLVHTVTIPGNGQPVYHRQGVEQRPTGPSVRWAEQSAALGRNNFIGDIYEIAIYDRLLTDEEARSVSYYLRAKYDLY